jgi:drug/metabolite transporter superfamily protein YnfA
MSRNSTILVLFLAAVFEAGGDALVRIGLRTPSLWPRVALFLVGSVVLFSYAWTMNAPPWDFGRLIGLYVVFFFVVAQAISWVGFKQTPSMSLMIGGLLIVSGGLVIALAKA